jgi:hypothetical protein
VKSSQYNRQQENESHGQVTHTDLVTQSRLHHCELPLRDRARRNAFKRVVSSVSIALRTAIPEVVLQIGLVGPAVGVTMLALWLIRYRRF